MLERLTAKTPNQEERTKRERVRGGCRSHQLNPAAQWTSRRRMMKAKIIAPCPPPPLFPDHLASVSQQMVKSCGAWLRTPHQPKSCGSFRGGWSRWWRRRSRNGGGGEAAALEVEAAALEVELLQRRRLWRRTLLDLLGHRTKTIRHQALTAKLRGPLQALLRILPKILPLVHLCTHSLSEVILHIPHPIFLRTCPC